eukprot:1589241-Pleurochrysis_carterae.AAC.1
MGTLSRCLISYDSCCPLEVSSKQHPAGEDSCRPAGLALYGQLKRKSVGSPEAAPLRSAPSMSGIVNI